jgi:hypothetical protein
MQNWRRGAHQVGTPQSARVSASQAILDRGYGRPATFSTTDTTQLKRAIDMTDDELAAIVAKDRQVGLLSAGFGRGASVLWGL